MYKKSSIPLFFWISLSIAFLVIAGSILYYLVIFLPYNQKTKTDTQLQSGTNQISKEEQDSKARANCYNEAKVKAREKLDNLYKTGVLNPEEKREYEKITGTDLAKKADIDYFFDLCLQINGLK